MWTASRGVLPPVTALLVLAGACASTSSHWRAALDRNTVEGYEEFLRANPATLHTPHARLRIAQLRWEGMRSSTDLAALEALELDAKRVDAPAGMKLAGEVRERRAVVAWAELRDGRDPAAIDAFLAEFPDASVRVEAEARVEALAWEEVSRKPGPAAWRSYLGRFPSGPHADAVRAGGEGVCWQEARASGDEAKVRQHLALFPGGSSGLRDLQLADEPRARLVTGGEAYVRVQAGWVPAIEPFFSKR